MNIYKVLVTLTLLSGLLLLTPAQARRREYVIKKVNEEEININDLNFPEDFDIENKQLYRLTGKTQFKVGEIIGFDGELSKTTVQNLTNIKEIESEENEKIDPELVNAIGMLDPNKEGDFSESGKPELKLLKDFLKRKITAAERDAAFEEFKKQQSNKS